MHICKLLIKPYFLILTSRLLDALVVLFNRLSKVGWPHNNSASGTAAWASGSMPDTGVSASLFLPFCWCFPSSILWSSPTASAGLFDETFLGITPPSRIHPQMKMLLRYHPQAPPPRCYPLVDVWMRCHPLIRSLSSILVLQFVCPRSLGHRQRCQPQFLHPFCFPHPRVELLSPSFWDTRLQIWPCIQRCVVLGSPVLRSNLGSLVLNHALFVCQV